MALPDVRAAVRRALANYLRTALTTNWPTLVVTENWPTPKAVLPPIALTVLSSGQVTPVDYHAPVVWSSTDTETIYSYGRVSVPLQVDAWCQFEATRDDFTAAVAGCFNQNVEITLGTATLANLAHSPGLVLAVSDYANVTAEYVFTPTASNYEESSNAMVGEWRATWTGDALIYLMATEVQPLMKEVTVELNMNGGGVEVYPFTYQGQVQADAPLIYWRLGDAVGSITAQDVSTHSRTGVVAGAVTFGATGLLATGSTPNDVNTSALGSATVQGPEVSRSGALSTASAFSVEWWVRPSALTAGGNDIGAQAGAFSISQLTTGGLSISIGATLFTTPAGTYVIGTTGHYVLTYDGTNARFYKNGQLVIGPTSVLAPLAATSFAVGATGPWQGKIQEVALYDHALSTTRILNHYFLGSNGP